MTIEKQIDLIYEKLYTIPLSNIIPLLLPVALDLSDYEGYCILTYWGKPIASDVGLNVTLRKDTEKVLLGEGLAIGEILQLEKSTFEDYINLRTVGENQMLGLCAKEMEDKIKSLDDVIEAVEPPQGLAPLDLYYRSAEATSHKLTALESRKQVEQQYAVLQSYLMTKLAEYKRKAASRERKLELEKGIRNSKKVFIIHGHNEAKRRELEMLIKEQFGLIPIVLLDQPDQGLTIIEKFEKYAADCSYAFALFTPDDIVTNGEVQYFQARPNVIFELGWFYANLGRSRVCILDQASEQSKIFSDLQGVLRMQFNENISEKYIEIERELKSLGII